MLVKSDGEPTYLLPDIAYHRDKFAGATSCLIDIWGADHHGYVARLQAGVQALGHTPDQLELILGQLVSLVKGGEQVQLSKRAGELVLLDDLVAAVGSDVARLTFLLQSLDTRQTIDLDLITAQSNENPVFYVQYANARIHSIGRKVAEARCDAAARSQRQTSPCSPTSASSTCSASCLSCPTSSLRPAPTGPPTRSPPGSASWRSASTASTTTAT